MAEPLSIIASAVGIVGFGIQVAQILQKQAEETKGAKDQVEQIVVEIRATTKGLDNLKQFLIEDGNDCHNATFNEEGRLEVSYIIRHCNTVFRNITVLVAKAGNGVLSQVDLFQRRMEDEHKKLGDNEESNVKLEIELSNLDHLLWPWRLPKIQQYLADMDRLKLSLVLILSVANLAKTKKQRAIKANDEEPEKWEGSDAETLVEDEIFYQDQGLREAEEKLKAFTAGPSLPDLSTRSKQTAAELLIQCWPNSPSGRGFCTVAELHDAGVILETWTLVANDGDGDGDPEPMPFNLNAVQHHALTQGLWNTKNPRSPWTTFAKLPILYQRQILSYFNLRSNRSDRIDQNTPWPYSRCALISLQLNRYRRLRVLNFFRRVLTFDTSEPSHRATVSMVIARMPEESTLREKSRPGLFIDREYEADPLYSESTYSTDSYDDRRFRSRRRRDSNGRRSRSRSPGPIARGLAGLAVALGSRLAGRRERKERQRRSWSRRQKRSRSVSIHSEYTTSSSAQSPPLSPQRLAVSISKQEEEPAQMRRIHTLTEADGKILWSEERHREMPSRKATEDEITPKEPVPELPPPRRRTATFTFDREDDSGPAMQALRALKSTNKRVQTGKSSAAPNIKTVRRNRASGPSGDRDRAGYDGHDNRYYDDYNDIRSRPRRRSRSRSKDRKRIPFGIISRRRTSRSRSRSRSRRRAYSLSARSRAGRTRSRSRSRSRPQYIADRSRQEPHSGLQLLTSSPSRPIVRTFEEDGVPPSQRDKAAVAEYYLKKWTTAYHFSSVGSRSRSKRHEDNSAGHYPGLIEYGSELVYGGNDATARAQDEPGWYGGHFPMPPHQTQTHQDIGSQKLATTASFVGKQLAADPIKEIEQEDELRNQADLRKESEEAVEGSVSSRKQISESRRNSEASRAHEADEEAEREKQASGLLEAGGSDQRARAESVSDVGNDK